MEGNRVGTRQPREINFEGKKSLSCLSEEKESKVIQCNNLFKPDSGPTFL